MERKGERRIRVGAPPPSEKRGEGGRGTLHFSGFFFSQGRGVEGVKCTRGKKEGEHGGQKRGKKEGQKRG